MEQSEDGGATWGKSAAIDSPEGIDAIQPSILFHPDGRLQMLARTRQGVIAMTWSDDDGHTWSPIAASALPNPNAGIDAVTLKDGRQLLVYNPTAHDPDTPGKGKRYPAHRIGRAGIVLVVIVSSHFAISVFRPVPRCS